MLPRKASRRLAAAVVAVLVTNGVQVVDPALASSPGKGTTPAPVSNAFAMGGGIGGQIDQRTGAFQASVPLLNVSGRGGENLSVSLSYDQNLAVQGAAGNRFGFGAGWALGLPWVNTAGTVRVYAASGGSFVYDTGSPTGLHEYPLRDLTFAKTAGTLSGRAGVPQTRNYSYTLKHYDGTVDYFDPTGNMLEQVDRFGNLIDVTWKQSGSSWQPTSVVDNYGQVTTFDYSTPGQVTVTAPTNAEGIAASTTLNVQGGMLRTVTDASGAATSFSFVSVGSLTGQLLHTVTAPSGARTTVTYTPLTYETSVIVVSNVQVTDSTGNAVQTQRSFSANVAGNGQHNYTGYPTYNKSGTDGLFDSNDKNYRYSTTLSDGRSSVTETYSSLHLMITRAIRITDPVRGSVLQQVQTYTYPSVATVQVLPPNYAKPTGVTVVYGDPVYGGTRTTTSSSTYDDRGELTSSTDETGTVTTTSYDPTYGVPLSETSTGADGTTSITTNALTADNSAVHTSTTAVGTATQKPTARTITTYAYDDSGQVLGQSMTWAPGAEPAAPSGGPDQIDTTRTITVDTTAHTRTVAETQATGTNEAATTTTITDLVTGNILSTTDPDHLKTSFAHDALGRVTSQTAPGNRITTTAYPTPLVTVVTDPTGHVTRTTTDTLGRTVKVTDNVVNTVVDNTPAETLGTDPTARTLTVNTYSVDGSTATSTPTTGATTTTSYDPLQRPIKIVNPDGLTQSIAYDDVAHTKTTAIIPIKAQTASAVSVDQFDNLARTISSTTTYADNTAQRPTAQTYDGLGRLATATANDVAATAGYTGAGGVQKQVNLNPLDTASFPGGTEVASTENTLTGALNTKTLTDYASTGTTSTSGAALTYDAAGRVATATDAGGGTTSYTYTPGGKPDTVTGPTGTVTTYTYSSTTGQLLEKDLQSQDGTTQKIGYTYYPDSALVETIYDVDHSADVITYQYDPDGHTTSVHYPDGTSTAARYDLDGTLATTTDVTGAVTSYQYDTAGIVQNATQTRGGVQLATVTYGYDALDRVHTIDRGNGVLTTITYSDASQITDELTTAGTTADTTTLRDDSYTYDAHGNTATHTTSGVSTATATTRYGYDAYDRLLSSAVYPNATGTGTPTSTAFYVLDAGGNVTGLTTNADGTTSKTVNTISPGDRLTTQTVDGAATSQTYNLDGTVHQDLNGNSYQYNPAGQATSVTTADGTSTTYAYWPDGTRRSASTSVGNVTDVTTLHYDTTGRVANDTYTDSSGSSPAIASYLIGVHRESRSLVTGPLSDPAPPPSCRPHHRRVKCPPHHRPCHHPHKRCTPQPPTPRATTSADEAGTGYYVSDAHGSMVSMTDPTGAVAATYHYSDYGQPLAGTGPAPLAIPAATAAGNATINPFTYDSAYTDPTTGIQVLPARTYDPSQGRFLSLDSTNMLNRYQAFDTNPIANTDPSGHAAVPDIVSDGVGAFMFVAFFVLSFIPFVGQAMEGAAAIAELSTASAISFASNGLSVVANAGAAATSLALTADDGAKMNTGKALFSDDVRDKLETANFALGTAASGLSVIGGGASIAAGKEAEATLAATEGDLATANTNLGTETARATSASNLAANLNTTLAATNAELAARTTELAGANAGLADANTALAEANTRLATSDAELAKAQTALRSTQESLNTTKGQLDVAELQLTSTRQTLSTTSAELTSTKIELNATAKQVADLTAKLGLAGSGAAKAFASDPNSGPEAAPTTATQGFSTPIDAARGQNAALSQGWQVNGNGRYQF